jgi:DNA topoisomerase I
MATVEEATLVAEVGDEDEVPEGLCYVSDAEPGIVRRGRSRFRYLDERTGEAVPARVRERITALAIPPAWTDVWICASPSGHVQATGRDARGRKQYRYHPEYRSWRDSQKYRSLLAFGTRLGDLRSAVDEDLRRPTLCAERVTAAVVRMLDLTYVRIGNEEYARDNKTYGLTTLRSRHVTVSSTGVDLRFPAKGGQRVEVRCDDRRLARLVRRCQDLPGQVLFQYLDGEDDRPVPVSSGDVNDYLAEATGVPATAKTFRTWGGSLLAAVELAELDPPGSERAAASALNAVLEPVAEALGNTVAVCRGSYVHPAVVESFRTGRLPELWAAGPSRAAKGLDADERRLLHVLAEVSPPQD